MEKQVLQKAQQVCVEIYKVAMRVPDNNNSRLQLQLRQAALSVPSDIARGFAGKTSTEYTQALERAHVSICELGNKTLACKDSGYLDLKTFEGLQKTLADMEGMLKDIIKSAVSTT